MIPIGHASFPRGKIAVLPPFVLWCLAICLLSSAIPAQALALTGVQSRKTHAPAAGSYDLPIDTQQNISGGVTIESRAIGAGHNIVFQFDGTITSTGVLTVIDEGSAAVAGAAVISAISNNEIVVTLPALPDKKRVSISLAGVNGGALNVTAALGFTLGDTNNSGTVSAIDVSRVKARSGRLIDNTNFQFDVNTTGVVTASDVAAVKVRSGLFPVNAAPVVSAGGNQTITLPAVATLAGTASDDGLPNPPAAMTIAWSRISGPATVTFGNANAAATTASFAGPGTYVLRLTASDGQLTSSSDVTIAVNASVLPGLFEKLHGWNKDVSALPPSARSAAIITALQGLGGWGNVNKLQIDFSIAVLYADSTTPRRTITAAPGYCFGPDSPDCDPLPMQMPIPTNGNTEGSVDYTCPLPGDDCHVLVVERTEKKLYELYQADGTAGSFVAFGAFTWDLTKQYGDVLRGDQCTSADAAGLPMAALIPTADEVATGEVPHALRFILPNLSMRAGVYVRPATHAGGPASNNANAPPYGVRFRLKASFDETPFSTGARVILRAMKRYGMILSDGGNIALTFADDRLSIAKWDALGITAQSFLGNPQANPVIPPVSVDQFEVVDLDAEIPLTYECVRAP